MTSATTSTEQRHGLQGSIGVAGIVFLVIAAAAPLTADRRLVARHDRNRQRSRRTACVRHRRAGTARVQRRATRQ